MSSIGSFIKIDIDGKLLVGEMSNSRAVSANLIDVSSKSSGRDTNLEYGRVAKTGSFSFISSSTPSATELTFHDLEALIDAGTKVTAFITNYTSGGVEVIGDNKVSGFILISNLSQDNPDNDKISCSADYQFDGATTTSVNI